MLKNLNFPRDQMVFQQVQLARIAGVQRTAINRRVQAILAEKGILQDRRDHKKLNVAMTRELLEPFFADCKPKIRHKINMFYNFKGGTGKTTICYQISTILAFMGFNVLCIDCDPQGHLTSMFGLPENHQYPTIYDAMINGVRPENLILPIFEGFDLIPSALSLTKIEIPLSQKIQRESILTRILQTVSSRYDFIMLDANPAFSMLNLNILMAAQQLNVVCETQPFSLSGLTQMIEELEQVFAEFKRKLVYHVIPNKFEAKTAAAQEVLGALRKDYRAETTETVVRKCEEINISTKKRLPALCFTGKNSSATEDLLDLVHEFLELTGARKRIELHKAA